VNRTLLGSLRALSQGAEAYGRGDFNHEIAALQSAEFESIRHRLAIMASELAKARQSAEASRERLEREVAARTEDLAEANRRLEEAAEARRNFFADVSHELRTPLTVIRGEAEIALRGGERRAADYRDSLARIVEQSSMMGRMVEDLLFIARADAGEPRMEMRSVAVGTLLSDIAASFEALATAHEVRISRSCGDNGAVVLGDRDRLAQVLGVLIDNAIRYSRKGGEVRLSSSIDDDKAVISVVDDGIGISPDDFGRVFDRFYRGENAKDHSAAGVGLGLSVAKAIIEAHNGHIRLAPSSSGGVAASIALPIETKLRAIS
jgi:signal transduction histidine kinase